MTVIAVIPARYGSTRFPGKALALIQGKPMIQWVYERATRSRLLNEVIVATDDIRIRDAVAAFGGGVQMTSPSHPTGTDRIAEVAQRLECDIIVNVQGDEPLIRPEMIDRAIAPLIDDSSIQMGTLCIKIKDPAEASDPNVVKVVFDSRGFALYFSRAPIPWNRDSRPAGDGLTNIMPSENMFKHVGLYVYRRNFLLKYAKMPQTALERIEKLEQLRALELGHKIRVVETTHESFGVDIPEDLGKIERYLAEGGV